MKIRNFVQSTMSPNHRLSGHYASVYPSQHDANLVLSTLRHQRDLFSGGPSKDLGIPDVNTHVGSVVHAFENLAYQRQLKEGGEKPYESSKSSSSAGKKESIYKIILPPPPPKTSTGTFTNLPKQIVRHRPKSKAPDVPNSSTNTASATTQTTKFSGDENESSAMDSLNLEDDYRRQTSSNNNKFPQSYIKNFKMLPPFVPPPPRQPSRIPTKTVNKTTNQQTARNNRMSDSLLLPTARTDVFLKPTKYSEDDIESDFLRGSTVSQSFIKNVIRKPPTRKISTYEQNFLVNNDKSSESKVMRKTMNCNTRDQKSRSTTTAKLEQPLIDEVSLRYKEYNSNNDVSSLRDTSNRQQNFQPRSVDRAEL